MLTRLRTRALARSNARWDILLEVTFIMHMVQDNLGRPHPRHTRIGNILLAMEQYMEEQHDERIASAIWDDTRDFELNWWWRSI